ncbi:MAG: SPOR domain-containing protein [Pseudohongiellaceae bacterium]
MSQATKQRLIGAIILGCIAVIFLPVLLDGEGLPPPQMNILIPTPPEFPLPLETESQRPIVLSDTDQILIELEESAEVIDSPAVSDNDFEQRNNQELPILDSEGLPQSWSIRLGLFGDAANAETLITDLLSQDYRAYSDFIPTSQGDLTAVFVGPVLTLNEAESLRIELSNSFNVDALIVGFGINERN